MACVFKFCAATKHITINNLYAKLADIYTFWHMKRQGYFLAKLYSYVATIAVAIINVAIFQ